MRYDSNFAHTHLQVLQSTRAVLCQLLWHRHRLVQMRTRIMSQLQALAMNENKCWKKKLWSERGRAEFEKLPLGFWAGAGKSCWSSWTG